MTAPLLTDAQVIAQLGSGIYWSSSQNSFIVPATITFDIPTSIPAGATGNELVGASTLNAAQVAAAILTANLWDDLIAPSLQQVASTTGQIEFANSTYLNTITAYAYTNTFYNIVGPVKTMAAADIWFNNLSSPGTTGDLTTPVVDNYAFLTFMHEFGHALGLNHMGPYNGTGNATTQASGFQDSTLYSVMSYFGPDHDSGALDPVNGYGIVAWGNWSDALGNYYSPQTPMMNDVLAIQAIYGASTTTRTGNTVYGFHSNITGNEAAIYDFSINAHPILCIWDSSGNDTLDLSGYATNSRIDLNPGTFSDANGMTNNISIARNAIIENAVGGLGNDVIVGNAVADTLSGGAGNDTITGGAGNDLLIGGSGADTLNGGAGNNTASYAGSTVSVQVDLRLATVQVSTGDASGDILSNIQNLIGSSFNDMLTGDGNANVLNGGLGNDTLNGGLGNDTLVGSLGFDTLIGGGGVDTIDYSGLVSAGLTAVLDGSNGYALKGGANGTDTLTGITDILGNNGSDIYVLKNGTYGVTGGSGNDIYIVDNGGDTITEAANGGWDAVLSSATSFILPVNVEYLQLNANNATGTDANASGTWALEANGTNDTLVGGLANDIYVVHNAATTITDTGGTNTVISYSSFTLSANVLGTDILALVGNNTTGTGNNLGDVLQAFGTGDTLIGGTGNDLFEVTSTSDVVQEAPGGGFDTLWSVVSSYVLPSNVEEIVVLQAGGTGIANAAGGILVSGSSNDILQVNAGSGSATLYGNGLGTTFRFAGAGFGHDVIGGFTEHNTGSATPDVIDLTALHLAGLSGLAITGGLSGAVPITTITINGDATDQIILYGTLNTHLIASDFLF